MKVSKLHDAVVAFCVAAPLLLGVGHAIADWVDGRACVGQGPAIGIPETVSITHAAGLMIYPPPIKKVSYFHTAAAAAGPTPRSGVVQVTPRLLDRLQFAPGQVNLIEPKSTLAEIVRQWGSLPSGSYFRLIIQADRGVPDRFADQLATGRAEALKRELAHLGISPSSMRVEPAATGSGGSTTLPSPRIPPPSN